MTLSLKLTDTQLILLSAASQREDGLLVQPPRLRGGAATAVTEKLLSAALIAEVATGPGEPHWREEPDGRRIGLKITPAGLHAIGIGPEPQDATGEASDGDEPRVVVEIDDTDEEASPGDKLKGAPRAGSKGALVLSLLSREEGATLADLTAATGWLAHTTRAALTGLRQRGHAVSRSKGEDGTSVYRVTSSLQSPALGHDALSSGEA